MKILFIQPPGSYVEMPTLAFPCLQAELKKGGYGDIHFWDANLDYLECLIRTDTLEELRQEIVTGKRKVLSNRDEKLVLHRIDKVIANIEFASETFHSPERYFDPKSFDRSMRIVSSAVSLFNTFQDNIELRYSSNGLYCELNKERHAFSLQNVNALSLDPDFLPVLVKTIKNATVLESDFDLVAFTCANPDQFLPAVQIAKSLRKKFKKAHFIAGGSFISSIRDTITGSSSAFDIFDSYGLFEGEEAIVDLCRHLEGKREISEVANLVWFDGKTIQKNALKKISDLNQLGTPDFSGVEMNRYWAPEPVLPAYSTRGCFFDICSFCNHHENYFGNFRTRKVDLVLDDLEIFKKKYGCTHIFFVDELMIPRDQVTLAEKIAGRGLETRWYAHTRVTHKLDRERMEVLAKGGLSILHVGMESANTEVLKLMDKGYNRETVLEFLENRKGLGLGFHLNTIEGFPGETRGQYLETLETALEYATVGDFVHLYFFELSYGAPIFNNGSKYIEFAGLDEKIDLERSLKYSPKDAWIKGSTNEGKIKALKIAMNREGLSLAGLFPKEAVWASHLLYRSWHMKNNANLLDKPLTELLGELQEKGLFGTGVYSPKDISLKKGAEVISLDAGEKPVFFVFDPDTFEWHQIPAEVLDAIENHRALDDLSDEHKGNLLFLIKTGCVLRTPTNGYVHA